MKGVLLILAASVMLLGLTYVLTLVLGLPWLNHYLVVLGFLVFLTIVSDAINKRALEQEGSGVIIPYIVSTIIKLIFSVIFLILFIRQHMDFAGEIVFSFLIYYAVFSAVEIVIVNKRLRVKKF